MGLARPRRTASTPGDEVWSATAPMPGIMTPSFPVAGLMLAASCVAAPGVDMLGSTLLVRYSVLRGLSSIAYEGWEAQITLDRGSSKSVR